MTTIMTFLFKSRLEASHLNLLVALYFGFTGVCSTSVFRWTSKEKGKGFATRLSLPYITSTFQRDTLSIGSR